jgi:hypothetical protein
MKSLNPVPLGVQRAELVVPLPKVANKTVKYTPYQTPPPLVDHIPAAFPLLKNIQAPLLKKISPPVILMPYPSVFPLSSTLP